MRCAIGRRPHVGLGALALLASVAIGRARAADFERLDVTEGAGVYRIEASLLLDAPPEAVVGALLDFEAQRAIAPPIRDVRILGTAPGGEPLVEIVTEICIGPFCKGVKQVQAVRFVPPGTITAAVIRGRGDLRSGSTTVEVSAEGGRTRIRMDCALEPLRGRPFFIPRAWVLNAIRRQARQSASGLEALALRIASRRGARGADRPDAAPGLAE